MASAKRYWNWTAIFEAILAVAIWGASFVATKTALRDVSPIPLVWARFTIGLGVLGAFSILRKQNTPFPAKDIGYLALAGFLGITVHQLLQSNGLITSQAITTGWIITTTPAFIAVLSWMFLKERLSRWSLFGFLLALVGVFLVISRGDWEALKLGQFGAPGDWLVLISAPNWAIFTVLSRSGLKRYPAVWLIFLFMLFGWIFYTVLLAIGGGWVELANLSSQGWIALLYLGIFTSGLAYVFWYDALQKLTTTQTGAFLYLEPFFTMITAFLILGETITPAILIGGGIILAGVWLINRVSAKDVPD